MEHVALNNVQLDYLARDDPHLKPITFTGRWPVIVYPSVLSRPNAKGTLSTPTRTINRDNIG